MKFSIRAIARALGVAVPSREEVTGWSVDSRTLEQGDLFFALRGPNHDGHAYLGEVFARGAVAAVVDQAPPDTGPEWTLLRVEDTQRALEALGSWAREQWGKDVIGVTGSAGKTTTKDVIAAMLSVRMAVGKTVGNLNNHIGVPLTLLRLHAESAAAVVEMGMNHAGEIAGLARIAKPRVGVVTNVGYAHVENFHSIEGVAAAKRELIEALPADGVAVLNADDARVARFAEHCRGRVVTYGISGGARVRAEEARYSVGGVRFRVGGVAFESRLAGRHGVSNLLAGIAAASVYGISPEEVVDVVKTIEPGAMRGRRVEQNGILHIDDCYNSNPDAARAMLDLLADTPARRRVAVLGEMLELGAWSETLHREMGIHAARSGTNVLVGIRGAARHAVEAAVESGLPAAYFFEDPAEAGEFVKGMARAGDVILWKGSRGTRVELALEKVLG